MNVDFLIVGQGISGSWLSYYLNRQQASFIVVDKEDKNSASRVAAGVINPVTGRRHVEVWMADELIPFALDAYKQMGSVLGLELISQKNILDFFPSAQMRVSFNQRVEENNKYVKDLSAEKKFEHLLQYEFGYGEISPVYLTALDKLLPAWRNKLISEQRLLDENFEQDQLVIHDDNIEYKNICAKKVIFCDGIHGYQNALFSGLPFAPNKGEVLIAKIPDLPRENILKKTMVLVPVGDEDLFWVGSTYAWQFEDAFPTEAFRIQTEKLLQHWLKVPFSITEHTASIRPATLERRPFVGWHPLYPTVGILNGLGTKGCSLAPFFANQFVEDITSGKGIQPDASVQRFRKILMRKIN